MAEARGADDSSVSEVKATSLEDAREKYEFFWKSQSPFSQWHKSKFYVDGQEYNCAEQFMMHQKAVLFGDQNAATKILTSKDPRFQKKMGRQVKNFEEDTWTSSCVDIVKKASKAKFSQNAELRSVLLATYPKILVEASPYDNIWGIGCTEDDQAAWNRSTWRGKNLLGFALTDVRNELMGEDRQSACAEDSG